MAPRQFILFLLSCGISLWASANCVSDCQTRASDGSGGSCLFYGADFCGENASCSANCETRGIDGSCLFYGADICSSDPSLPPWTPPTSSCVPDCQTRASDGSGGNCLFYGADYCGVNASCSPNCETRDSNGSCLFYGADICSGN